MIKTFISEDITQLDKMTNDFMCEKARNLPVRTESFVVNYGNSLKIYHKNTVFFDENLTKKEEIEEINVPENNLDTEKETKATNKIGALWIQSDGKMISGTLQNERIVIPENIREKIHNIYGSDKLEMKIKDSPVVIIRNKFKNTAKHPDFVIMKGGN